ncbi:RNA transcription; translation and transport factor protein [Camelus dromedarius]|uniref:RNA transcription, translation and transport factor protein n=1 Tax=Camelus dromedarius TaxID=9838 RepID=A0A5N4EFU4_CAMDR|nr:RNA transcription; translation and transport factor protein [Camelus dromedarius]
MLKAIRILVQECLKQDAVAKANQTKGGLSVALDKHIPGFDTGDAVLNDAAQILRLPHIKELRELQTKINKAIVAVQAITANPQTDHRLGKVADERFRISASHLLSTAGNQGRSGMCLEMSCFRGKNPRKLTMFQRLPSLLFL